MKIARGFDYGVPALKKALVSYLEKLGAGFSGLSGLFGEV